MSWKGRKYIPDLAAGITKQKENQDVDGRESDIVLVIRQETQT